MSKSLYDYNLHLSIKAVVDNAIKHEYPYVGMKTTHMKILVNEMERFMELEKLYQEEEN